MRIAFHPPAPASALRGRAFWRVDGTRPTPAQALRLALRGSQW